MLVAGTCLLASSLVQFVLRRRAHRLERELAQVEYLVCPKCRYDLRNLESATGKAGAEIVCPECGSAFNVAELRKTWEKTVEAMKAV